MSILTVITNTVFKALPKQSIELDVTQKAEIIKDKSFEVKSVELKRGHYLVELTQEIPPVGKSGYFFAGHVQIEDIDVNVPGKIVRVRKNGRNWFASVDSGSEFFVGKDVPYDGNRGLQNIADNSAGQYQASDYRGQYGFWADFIAPTAKCESNGFFNCLNTYDRAFFTFGFLQYAAHVTNGDFVKFFSKLLETPLGKGYFPELFVQTGQIFRETDNGNTQLTNNDSTEKLLMYLNPTLASIEEKEVIQAAKFIHWAIHSPQHRDIQVQCGIEHFKQSIQRHARWYPLGGVPDKVCVVIEDIHHQGRAKKSVVYEALDTNGDYEEAFQNLLETGQQTYPERLRTLSREIQQLISNGILGRRVYNNNSNDFELV